MKNRIFSLLFVGIVFLSGCSGLVASKHALRRAEQSVSVMSPEEYERRGVEYITYFKFAGPSGLVGTEGYFDYYQIGEHKIPIVEGGWALVAMMQDGRFVEGEAFLNYRVGENPMDSSCAFKMVGVFPERLIGGEKILLSGRDGDRFYNLHGREVLYDIEKYNSEEEVEYQRYLFLAGGTSLIDLGIDRARTIRVGTAAWGQYVRAFSHILPHKYYVPVDGREAEARSTRFRSERFRDESTKELGFSATGRWIKKGALQVGALGAAMTGAPGALVAGVAGDLAASSINTRWSGHSARALAERGELAQGVRFTNGWCRQAVGSGQMTGQLRIGR